MDLPASSTGAAILANEAIVVTTQPNEGSSLKARLKSKIGLRTKVISFHQLGTTRLQYAAAETMIYCRLYVTPQVFVTS